MRFWDTSALLPLLVQEASSAQILTLYREDPHLVVWWGTPVEATSALARLEREGSLSAKGMQEALKRLRALEASWTEVLPTEQVRTLARRLLRVHNLRAMDALQLAAALVVSEARPSALAFVSLDARLNLAAEREGLKVLP